VCEPIFNKPLKDISFGQVLVRLFSIARAFDMEVQPQLVLLQKTLLNIEGLGRQMYPELDLWQTGQPVLREWMAERTGPKAMVKRFKEELPEIRYMLDQLPAVARKILERLDEPATPKQPDRQSLLRWAQQRYLAFTGALSLLAGVLLIGQQAEPVWLGWALGGFAAVLLYAGRPRS
jgi:ubiquinone biosynthesis protein